MNKQMTFDFVTNINYSVGNFIVSCGNIDAFCYLNEDFEEDYLFKNNVIFLSGESKCGKTHLGQIWKQKHNANNIDINSLIKMDFTRFISEFDNLINVFDYYLIDNFPEDISEDKFLFILNTVMTKNSNILIISRRNLKDISININDLKSRINAATHLKIDSLSKDMKPMLINKLFADKQIFIDGVILKYLDENLNTNYSVIFNFVEKIYSELISSKDKLNLKFVKKFFQSLKNNNLSSTIYIQL